MCERVKNTSKKMWAQIQKLTRKCKTCVSMSKNMRECETAMRLFLTQAHMCTHVCTFSQNTRNTRKQHAQEIATTRITHQKNEQSKRALSETHVRACSVVTQLHLVLCSTPACCTTCTPILALCLTLSIVAFGNNIFVGLLTLQGFLRRAGTTF